MKKGLKILLVSVAGFLIFFGLVGVVLELTSENTELFGIILGAVFIISGGFLLNMGIRGLKEKPSEAPADIAGRVVCPTVVEEQVIPHSFWQHDALVISSWVELVFMGLGIIFALFFGIAGFAAGGMGGMVGLIMVMALIGLAAGVSVRAVVLSGLVKRKLWAPVLNLILVSVEAVVFITSGFWPLLVYVVFSGWCSIYLIRHKSL